MRRTPFTSAAVLACALLLGHGAAAQKRGGVLHIGSGDSPASMSVMEEATPDAERPMMAVFNSLIMFDQHVAQNSLNSIVSDLATKWAWNEDGTELTFTLRPGVKWHDGKPFTAADVKCTWDLYLDQGPEKLRLNPRKSSYYNLASVTTNGDSEVTFHLKRPQPAFPMILAGGFSVIYPCHVPPSQMRQHPIGTGPFKFVEFKPNQNIKLARNPDYWKPGRPYLDGLEYPIIKDPATAVLAFVAGKVDVSAPYSLSKPLLQDVQKEAPQAICEVTSTGGINRHLLVNYKKPPFDNPKLRHAMAMSIDRKAFIDTLTQGQGQIGGVLQPPPEGLWGRSPEEVQKLPGYSPDVQQNREQARTIMRQLGYGPDHPLAIKVTTRDLSVFRDPSILLIDQFKQVYIDAQLEQVELPQYYPKMYRKDFTVSLNLQTSGPDPDPVLYLFYACSSKSLNWDGYCNPEVDKLIEAQSREGDPAHRKQILRQIEEKLAADDARPMIFYNRAATCRQPWVKGVTVMVNSIFNGWRMEDAWLDK